MKAPLILQSRSTVTTVRHRLELDDDKIRSLLLHAGVVVPDNAKIIVPVPGGGDWSNCDLDIIPGCPVTVTWEETTHD